MDDKNPKGELLERLTYVLVKNNVPIDEIRQDFMIILKDYSIRPESTDVVVYQGDKNEFNLELRNEYEIRYCPNCGQKLDWRENNDSEGERREENEVYR